MDEELRGLTAAARDFHRAHLARISGGEDLKVSYASISWFDDALPPQLFARVRAAESEAAIFRRGA